MKLINCGTFALAVAPHGVADLLLPAPFSIRLASIINIVVDATAMKLISYFISSSMAECYLLLCKSPYSNTNANANIMKL